MNLYMIHYSNNLVLPHTLNDIQHQVLIGGLLGDLGLTKDQRSLFPRLKVDRQFLDNDYMNWQFNIFENLCKSPVKIFERFDVRYNKTHKYCSFRTRAVPAFLDYYNTWYPSGTKIVPEDIVFTPLILATWFCDDGCIISEKNYLTLKLSTESFGEKGAGLLSSKLESRFNCKFPIYRKQKGKDQFFIKASTLAARAFIKDIEQYVIEFGMSRKSDKWKEHNFNPDSLISRNKILDDLILSLEDFSIKKLSGESNLSFDKVNSYIGKFLQNEYFTKYSSNEKFNLYHFKLTDSGRIFFSS